MVTDLVVKIFGFNEEELKEACGQIKEIQGVISVSCSEKFLDGRIEIKCDCKSDKAFRTAFYKQLEYNYSRNVYAFEDIELTELLSVTSAKSRSPNRLLRVCFPRR